MVQARNRIALAAFLLSLACPPGLLGLSAAPTARQFSCNAPQRDAGPDWLVGRGPSSEHVAMLHLGLEECGYAMIAASSVRFAQNEAGGSTSSGRRSAWKQAGIYGLEFGTAAVGSFVSAVGAYRVYDAIYDKGDVWQVPSVAAGCGVYVLTSAVLSAIGTHFMGRLLGRGKSFGHALAGGALGGALGGVVLVEFVYSNGRTGAPSWSLLPVGLALPAIGSVTCYNVWRNNEPK